MKELPESKAPELRDYCKLERETMETVAKTEKVEMQRNGWAD